MTMRLLVLLFIFFNLGCVSLSLMHKQSNEVIKTSYSNKTIVIKSQLHSQYLHSDNIGKGWFEEESIARKNGKKIFWSLADDQCRQIGSSLKAKLLSTKIGEKTIPMYYSSGIWCSNGNCSGGGGGTYLRRESWRESKMQCVADRKLASLKNTYTPRVIEEDNCMDRYSSYCSNLFKRYSQTKKGQTRLLNIKEDERFNYYYDKFIFMCLKRKCLK